MELSQLKAVVSGGASGLGHAVATRIAADGGQVAILDINESQGERAAAALGERARYFKTDVGSEASVNAAVAAAGEAFGGINLAVSCAGILGAGRVLGRDGPMAGEHFARVITVNLVGTFLLAKASAAQMQHNEPNAEGERGVIVNTASVAAFEGQIGQAAYSASKAGVAGLALPLAR
jgi:NAD(P)-dependent dehydrogenase (short-subunit alcohol dehydrogenase family)